MTNYRIQNENLSKPEKWDSKIFHHMMSKSYKERLIIAGAGIADQIDILIATNK